MNFLNGRPRKHIKEQEKNIALGYLEAKHREPWLTQAEYARNYSISPRTLRRYIKAHAELTAIRIRIHQLETQRQNILREEGDDENFAKGSRGGLLVAWE